MLRIIADCTQNEQAPTIAVMERQAHHDDDMLSRVELAAALERAAADVERIGNLGVQSLEELMGLGGALYLPRTVPRGRGAERPRRGIERERADADLVRLGERVDARGEQA